MTREEYEKLLKSDYWKGYSYALIKERNFTCADCGRQFPNERNKLQVHHLVYRDVNPWSYRPDEIVVLCEECHKKRHGIKDEHQSPILNGKWGDSVSSSDWNWNMETINTTNSRYNRNERYKYSTRKGCRFKFRYVLYALLLLCILLIGRAIVFKTPAADKKDVPTIEKKEGHKKNTTKKRRSAPSGHRAEKIRSSQLSEEQTGDNTENGEPKQRESFDAVDESSEEPSSSEILERNEELYR